MQRQTLKEFLENSDNLDGYYAVWKSGFFEHSGSRLYGFSGDVIEYTNQEGFKNSPEWLDIANEEEVNIVLLTELPDISEF